MSKGLLEQNLNAPVMFKDTVFLDFLGLPKKHSESKLKKGLIEHMKQFILELGKDFIFMDQEYPLTVGASTYKADLLFFHRGLSQRHYKRSIALRAKQKRPKPLCLREERAGLFVLALLGRFLLLRLCRSLCLFRWLVELGGNEDDAVVACAFLVGPLVRLEIALDGEHLTFHQLVERLGVVVLAPSLDGEESGNSGGLLAVLFLTAYGK